jgi:hypothetical protein
MDVTNSGSTALAEPSPFAYFGPLEIAASVHPAQPDCIFGKYLFSLTFDLACWHFYLKFHKKSDDFRVLVSLDGLTALEHDDLRLPPVIRDHGLRLIRRVINGG